MPLALGVSGAWKLSGTRRSALRVLWLVALAPPAAARATAAARPLIARMTRLISPPRLMMRTERRLRITSFPPGRGEPNISSAEVGCRPVALPADRDSRPRHAVGDQ